MDLGSAVGLFVLAFIIWGIPLIFVATDPIISNKEKAIWVFAIWLASWLGWLLYQYVAPILPRPKTFDFDEQKARNQSPPLF